MINKFILPLLAVLVLASCSNKFSLVKRKYNKGYYVDMSKNSSHKKNESETAVALKTKKNASVSSASAETAELKVSTVQPVVISDAKSNAGEPKIYTSHKASKPLVASAKKTITETARAIKPVGEASATKSGKGDSGTNKILLVILALFPVICLIAVYLHDGKKITLNFWITLLLHLTFVLWVIFALLVVLDVIDLA